ncbi:MAG: hypothetical protein NXH75_01535 [Halobacteriovoraceae bacterium]|nr:hypothetical protein [Halobacteriovoraceae bacterium]
MSQQTFIDITYQETLEKLKNEIRPIIQLSPDEVEICLEAWNTLLEQKASEREFFPLLCILDHAKTGSLKFSQPIKTTLESRTEEDLLLHTLSASHKVIIEECQRQGERIPGDFIFALKSTLDHSSPEVVEWTLRTIEALGHQSIILKEEVIKRRPGLSSLFNKHRKASQQLVDYLIERWQGKTF